MLEMNLNDDYIFLVSRNNASGIREYLRIEEIPWWRRGGQKHVFTTQLHEATLLTYHRAVDFTEMHNEFRFERHVHESKVLTLHVAD